MDTIKEEQARIRKDMLALMNEDEDWYKKENTSRYNQIQQYAYEIETIGKTYRSITPEKFDEYVKAGYRMKEIAQKLHVSTNMLRKWREENDYP
ncbi:hypothetical protein D929_01917, partial [Enterococcus faecalis 02-MB-P-10]|uniref:hypothetical protein n=1 Tax=Enterococcus faecalis TaxID=1351 RepID=UPI000353C85E